MRARATALQRLFLQALSVILSLALSVRLELSFPRAAEHANSRRQTTRRVSEHRGRRVQGICEKHVVDAIANHLCKVVGICLDEHAVGEAAFGQPDARCFKQFAVYVDGDYRAPNLRKL